MNGRSRTPTREVWMYVKDPVKLRRRRKDKGFSQKQLASLIDRTQQYVSLLESGNDRDCSEVVADRICRWLDVDREDYFDARESSSMPSVASASRVAGDAA